MLESRANLIISYIMVFLLDFILEAYLYLRAFHNFEWFQICVDTFSSIYLYSFAILYWNWWTFKGRKTSFLPFIRNQLHGPCMTQYVRQSSLILAAFHWHSLPLNFALIFIFRLTLFNPSPRTRGCFSKWLDWSLSFWMHSNACWIWHDSSIPNGGST